MLEKLHRLLTYYRNLAEVESLGDRELADLGVSRDQARALAALPDDVPGRVAAMGRIFGISEAELTAQRHIWQELLSVCHQCRELPACRALMDTGTGTPDEAGFCPNRHEFADLRHAT